MRIAIVGNGIHASFKENGNFIDQCDIVIRMNKFVLEGYEKFVGSKISIISLMLTGDGATSGILGHEPLCNYIKKSPVVWIPDKYRTDHIGNRNRAMDHFKIEATHCFSFVPDKVYDSLVEKLKNISESNGDVRDHYYPDSGMTTIERCVTSYPNAEIFVTGFDPHKKHPSKYYHKLNGEQSEVPNYHPQLAQSLIMDEYLRDGKIKEID